MEASSKKHKSKPAQFGSVADGVQNRVQENIKNRKNSRLSCFDNIRDIPKCDSPGPAVNPVQSKVHLRRRQLEKWKEEKKKKKKEADLKKKKPFIVGTAPLQFLPLPPKPSTSKRATRSPVAKTTVVKPKETKAASRSFGIGLLFGDTSKIDSVDHLTRQLVSEIKRLTEFCETWDKMLEQTVLPEPVQEAVLTAVGQARLLMSQKLHQFASLVERCAQPEPGTALITPADLQGFWDMVFLQVENVHMKFKKLEELRLCGWVEEQPVEVKKKVVRPSVNVKKAAKPSAGPSRLKEIIAAARKAQKEQESTLQPPSGDRKSFEAGFFSVSTPVVRSPACLPATPARTPGSTSRPKRASAIKNSTTFAMLRASVLSKSLECDGFSLLPQTPVPKTPINLNATLGRSILQNTNTEKKSSRKAVKMVLLNRSDADLQDVSANTPESERNEQKTEEIQTASVLSKSLECDGFSLLPQTPVPKTPINLNAILGLSILQNTNTENKSSRKAVKKDLSANTPESERNEQKTDEIQPASLLSKSLECDGFSLLPQTPVPKTLINLNATLGRSILQNTNTEKQSSRKAVKMVLLNRSDVDLQDVSANTPESERNEQKTDEIQTASLLSKSLECDGFSLLPQTPVPKTPINLNATLGRSILQNTNTEKQSSRKAVKMVLLNRSDVDLQDVSANTPESERNEQKTDEIQTASLLSKSLECDGFSLLPQTPVPKTPINLNATLGRSILQNTNTEKQSSRKAVKMVLLNRSDVDLQDVSANTPESERNEQKTDEIQTASLLSKSLECDGFSLLPQTPVPKTPINLNATLGLSILQNTNTEKKSSRKAVEKDVSANTPESERNEQKTDEIQTASGISSMDLEKVENKEKSTRPKLVRQDAVNRSPKRSRRKSCRVVVEITMLDSDHDEEVFAQEGAT